MKRRNKFYCRQARRGILRWQECIGSTCREAINFKVYARQIFVTFPSMFVGGCRVVAEIQSTRGRQETASHKSKTHLVCKASYRPSGFVVVEQRQSNRETTRPSTANPLQKGLWAFRVKSLRPRMRINWILTTPNAISRRKASRVENKKPKRREDKWNAR